MNNDSAQVSTWGVNPNSAQTPSWGTNGNNNNALDITPTEEAPGSKDVVQLVASQKDDDVIMEQNSTSEKVDNIEVITIEDNSVEVTTIINNSSVEITKASLESEVIHQSAPANSNPAQEDSSSSKLME